MNRMMPAADFISRFERDMKSGGRDATPAISAGVTIHSGNPSTFQTRIGWLRFWRRNLLSSRF
jgi:hypothetical protein